jgi:uncharacterized membrane protein
LGSGPLEALKTCLTRPWEVLALLFSNQDKIVTLLCLFAPFLFGALFSPWGILVIPLVFERMLSSNSAYWVMIYHYNVMAAPVLCMASADGFYRLSRKILDPVSREKSVRRVVFFMLVFNLIIFQLPRFPLGHFIRHPFWRFTPAEMTGKEALGLVPADASVLAQSSLVPHLSHRPIIDMINAKSVQAAPTEDYVVVCLMTGYWPLSHQADLLNLLKTRENQGYAVLFNQDGWVVLKKTKVTDTVRPSFTDVHRAG